MPNLNAQHFLDAYQTRLEMQELGITNPPPEIKALTKQLVEAFAKLPPNEIIEIVNGHFVDSKGNLLAPIPGKQ